MCRKIFLINDEVARMSKDTERFTRQVEDHEGRLIRIETSLALAGKGSRLILPGSEPPIN